MKTYAKSFVVDTIWQYSNYLGNQLIQLQNIEENGPASLIYLFNLIEIIIKSSVDDYESNFYTVISKARNNGLINDVEHDFLNDSNYGIRKLRNVFAHANLSRFCYKLGNGPLLYPLSENENCQQLYNLISDIVFNILLKLVANKLIDEMNIDVNVDHLINSLEYQIVIITPEEILKEKGIDYTTITFWDTISESDKFRLAENARDVNVMGLIFQNLLGD